jgi:aspartate aminotransferase
MPLSEYVQRIQPSSTMAIEAKAKQMQRDGIDVISLAAGEPDFDTPEHIKEAGIKAIRDGHTKYTPAAGIPELKEAILQRLAIDDGLAYGQDQVIVNCGGKHTLYLAVAALVSPGDEVIVPAPYWVTSSEQPKLVGGNTVIVETTEEDGLKLTAQRFSEAITPRTKIVVINSPSNPSGAVYSRQELEALAEVAVEHGIHILSDEIYDRLTYDGVEHVSIASLNEQVKELTVIVKGVSKSYAMTGWRVGYAVGSSEVIAGMIKAQMQILSHTSSISQHAAVTALTGPQGCVEEMRQEYDRRRRRIVEGFNQIEGIRCPMPKGAFYAYPDISAHFASTRPNGGARINDGPGLCSYLLDEARVACVPGIGFGTHAHMRVSYATSMEKIDEALSRIGSAVKKLGSAPTKRV